MSKVILVTGGTGFLGSHTVVQLLERDVRVIVLDNLSNSKKEVLDRIEKIAGSRPDFFEGDIRDRSILKDIFKRFPVDAVIHFAGLKAVGESETHPLEYYDNNVAGSLTLLQEMSKANICRIIFSSSATVYGENESGCFDEKGSLAPKSVYGQTKLVVEDILRSLKKAHPEWKVAILRYFNPVGAHESGMLGEDPQGIPDNLMPFIAQVATGKRNKLFVFGNDYPTLDGTGVRDYIHVEDLAKAHLCALDAFDAAGKDFIQINLGTGRPYSVLELIRAFEKISGKLIPYEFTARREGDVATCYTNPALAQEILGWQARFGIEKMCADMWRWQSNNPDGY